MIPAQLRRLYHLTPGTQLEFVDEGGTIRLVVQRAMARSDPGAGYGMIKVRRRLGRKGVRRLLDFDAAAVLGP